MALIKRVTAVFVICFLALNVFLATAGIASEDKVVAYYFHGSFRCATCTAMEDYSRQAIETNFKDELDSGKLEFRAVNVEESDNKHYVNDYQLYTKSLILSFMKDGKEEKSKNLDKIWQLARNKQKFIDYVTSEIKSFLEDVK